MIKGLCTCPIVSTKKSGVAQVRVWTRNTQQLLSFPWNLRRLTCAEAWGLKAALL